MKSSVYIMSNSYNTVFYTGVTSDLKNRVNQHKSKKHPHSFSARYNICKLVYYESFGSIVDAIKREKLIKGGSRKKKIEMINKLNPGWDDLRSILDG